MRKYTLFLSVVAHMAAIAAVYIAPAFATDELPEPPRTMSYVEVIAKMPEVTPPIRRVEVQPTQNTIPTEPPDSIQPERPADPIDQPPVADPGAFVDGGAIRPIGEPGLAVVEPPPPARPKEPYRVGGVVVAPQRIVEVAPIYPPIAIAARKEGIVILEAVIAEDGTVQKVTVLRSVQLLDDAAIAAVKQWRFTPPRLNGEPIPVVMTVTVTFNLNK